jgi:hypothetical protein
MIGVAVVMLQFRPGLVIYDQSLNHAFVVEYVVG